MFKCLDCGHEFRKPRKLVESYEAWGRPVYQEIEACPLCYGWALEEFDPDECTEEEYD